MNNEQIKTTRTMTYTDLTINAALFDKIVEHIKNNWLLDAVAYIDNQTAYDLQNGMEKYLTKELSNCGIKNSSITYIHAHIQCNAITLQVSFGYSNYTDYECIIRPRCGHYDKTAVDILSMVLQHSIDTKVINKVA